MDRTNIMSLSPSEVEVAAKPTRRRYTAEYKHRILREAETCTRQGELGALLRREGLYSEVALVGYTHRVRVVRTPERAHRVAPHIHRVFSNLKTWLNGTYHGVEPKYLQRYLDEFVFRFNRRNTPMEAFQTLLGISTQKAPLTLPELVNRSQP